MSRRKVVRFASADKASRKALDKGKEVQFEGRSYPDYVGMGLAYAELVADAKIPAGRLLQRSCQRFLDMYEEAKAEKGGIYWSDAHAVEVCAFIETLTHVKGVLAKKRIVLEPWQIWICIAIYGFRWADTGDRVVTVVLLEVTRKQGKSLLAAAIGLYELGPNAHIGDDLFIIAPKEDQAKKILEPMSKMVSNDPSFRTHFEIKTTLKQITFGSTESYAVTLTAAGEKQDGHDPKIVIADEFHALPSSIFTVMKSSQGARPESLFLQIGSAGRYTFGVGWDERNAGIEVIEGRRHRPELFAAIYTIDDEDIKAGRFRDEIVIRKANPNAGVSTPMRKIKQEIEDIFSSPRNRSEVLRTRFNVWGMGASKLISAADWSECEMPGLVMERFIGQSCWVGVDLSSRLDMTCWAAIFEEDNALFVFAKHFVPEEGVWREDEEICDLYIEWQKAGSLTFVPGSRQSYELMQDDLLYLQSAFSLETVVVDDREANAIMAWGEERKVPMVSMRKNAPNFSDPTKDIQARAVGKYKAVFHDGNPVLAWNVENVIAEENTADLILPKKPSQNSPMKIDGVDCLVQANAARLNPQGEEEQPVSPMATRGVRTFGNQQSTG
ncbi:terminase large subunit [Oceaniradius stylonematis]|uniref:terminase large subunit n=1 Tax=Oceaniradius stylonematis TaxID=2184161 RepID=UPI00273D335C|nr:terminase TerL endonuclease subunit [Oceaniradius stylonematis]